MLVLRRGIEPERRGARERGGRKRTERKPRGAASETSSSADDGTGRPINRRAKSSRCAAILQGCMMSRQLQRAHTSSATDLRSETPANTLPVATKPLQGSMSEQRDRGRTRVEDTAAVLEETLSFFVDATVKDEA